MTAGQVAELYTTVTTNEDTATSWNYTISDVESVVDCSGSVSVTSSNTSLLPVSNITKSGTAPNCTLALMPASNQFGTSTVIVNITDGDGAVVKDQFVITVNSVNDVPVANADTGSVAESGTVLLSVLANDTDIENDTLTITSVSSAST